MFGCVEVAQQHRCAQGSAACDHMAPAEVRWYVEYLLISVVATAGHLVNWVEYGKLACSGGQTIHTCARKE